MVLCVKNFLIEIFKFLKFEEYLKQNINLKSTGIQGYIVNIFYIHKKKRNPRATYN